MGRGLYTKVPVCTYVQDVYGVNHASTCTCLKDIHNAKQTLYNFVLYKGWA